jgi:PTH1 family peptidyl-tRNA hydrolase
LKEGGGHAGHNGVRDIIEKLGSNEFKRLRIGVGHPGDSAEVINSVLGRPSAEDTEKIMESISTATDLVPQLLAGEFQKVMYKLHSSEKLKDKSEKENDDEKND